MRENTGNAIPSNGQIQTPIHELVLHKRKVIRDERGAVLHMLRNDSPSFDGEFGEIYFSKIRQGVTKGWKFHREIHQNFVVPVGEVEFEFYDFRKHSPTQGAEYSVRLSEENYWLISVPNQIWYAFRGLAQEESLIANFTSAPHRVEESLVRPYSGNVQKDLQDALEPLR